MDDDAAEAGTAYDDDLSDLTAEQSMLGGSTVLVEPTLVGDDQPVAQKKTGPYMTKYERARIIGTRALQISMNAPIMIELAGETDPMEIAERELEAKAIPFIVRRHLPDGSYEDWKVE